MVIYIIFFSVSIGNLTFGFTNNPFANIVIIQIFISTWIPTNREFGPSHRVSLELHEETEAIELSKSIKELWQILQEACKRWNKLML